MWLLLACVHSTPEDSHVVESQPLPYVDLREDFPEPDDDTILIRSPDFTIPPYSEIMYCTFGTWTGGDRGVISIHQDQSEFGHHAQLNSVTGEIPPDDTVLDCTAGSQGGNSGGTLLFESTRTLINGQLQAMLPDGMAMWLPDGQHWQLQSHYTNTSADTILVHDAYYIQTIPADQVQQWVSPWQQNTDILTVPEGESSMRLEGSWPRDFTVLSLWGHIHEHGAAIRFEIKGENGWETFYEVNPWDPALTNDPLPMQFEPDTLVFKEGTEVATVCTWENTSGAPVAFPNEMCATQGIGYSIQQTLLIPSTSTME